MVIPVKYLIKREAVKVEASTPLREAISIMAKEDIGSLLIFEGGKVVGILTERDVIKGLARGLTLERPVRDFGTIGRLITIEGEKGIQEAACDMKNHHIRHLVVVEGNEIVGVISIRDLLGEERVLESLSNLGSEEWGGSD